MKTLAFAFAAAVLGAAAAGPAFSQQEGRASGGQIMRPEDAGGARGGGLHGPVRAPERGASAHGIDLTTPDGGYANLRRRAERQSLIGHAGKKPVAGAVANSGAHPPGMPPRADAGTSRNAIGVLLSGGARTEPTLGAHGPGIGGYAPLGPKGEGTTAAGGGSALRGPALGSNGASGIGDVRRPAIHPAIPANPSPYPTGINGTSTGQIAARGGMIGGPAKNRSAISGTGMRPKF